MAVTDLSPAVPPIWRRLWRAYAPLAALFGIYYASARMVLDKIEAPISFDLLNFIPDLLLTLPFFLFGVIAVLYFRLFVFRDAEPPRHKLRRWVFQTPWLELIVLRMIPALAFIFGLQRIFVVLKPKIPHMVPFSWDLVFIEWDRWLFGGIDPWVLTHALTPSAAWAAFFDEIYVVWFFLVFACIFTAAVMPLSSRVRLTFLMAFAADWMVGGSLMATIFSSAGPVYVERLFGDASFAPLLDRLNALDQEQSIAAVVTIEKLWQGHIGAEGVPALGISAFPSMHLCLATTHMMFGFAFGRWWGIALAVFLAGILYASVHLGWHYLVDGIAGIAIGWAFWVLCDRFAGWWLGKGATR